jgi:hypothetical protein
MINNKKIVSVTPAGREIYLEILLSHIEKQRPLLDEHHFWLNTGVESDQKYIEDIVKKNPDFYKIVEVPTSRIGHFINDFWPFAAESNTIYIRFDDDICWISPNLVESLVKCRLENPNYWMIYPIIINNDMNYGLTYPIGTLDYILGWPERLDLFRDRHKQFFDFEKNGFPKINNIEVPFERKININSMCWFGEDLKDKKIEINEELDISKLWPNKTNRKNLICADCFVVHFSFRQQRRIKAGKLHLSNNEIINLIKEYKKLSK